MNTQAQPGNGNGKLDLTHLNMKIYYEIQIKYLEIRCKDSRRILPGGQFHHDTIRTKTCKK